MVPFHERVCLAHDAFQIGEFAHHDRYLVGLGQPGGFEGPFPHFAGGAGRIRQITRESHQTLGLVLHAAGLHMKDDLSKLGGHGLQTGGLVFLKRELGVFDPTFENPLVARRDLLEPGGVAVADVEEALGEGAVGIDQREVALMRLHGGLQHLGRQSQVLLTEPALGYRGILDQEEHFFHLAVGIDHLEAVVARHPFQFGPHESFALAMVDCYRHRPHGLHVISRAGDIHRPSQPAVPVTGASRIQSCVAERDDGVAPEPHQPADGAREAYISITPPHVLGEVHVSHHLETDIGQKLGGGPAFAPGDVVDKGPSTFFARHEIGGRHPFGPGKTLAGLGGLALRIEGRLEGRPTLHDLARSLLSRYILHEDGDTAGRDQDLHILGLDVHSLCAEESGDPGGKQIDGRPAGGRRHLLHTYLEQEVTSHAVVGRHPCGAGGYFDSRGCAGRRLTVRSGGLFTLALLDLCRVELGHLAGDVADPGDVACALGHADGAPRIEEVEHVRGLEHEIVSRAG